MVDAYGEDIAVYRSHPPAELAVVEVDRITRLGMVEHLGQGATDAWNVLTTVDRGR